jgi:hypothetical protein
MKTLSNWIFSTACLFVATGCQPAAKRLSNPDVQPRLVSELSSGAKNTEWLGTLAWMSPPDSRSAQAHDLDQNTWKRTNGREVDTMERYRSQWDSYLNGRRTTAPDFAPSPIAELMELRR